MIIEQTQDVCVRKLTSTDGKDLEIMANLTHPDQIPKLIEGFIDAQLGSEFGIAETEMLLRLSCSMKGRARDDLTTIGGKQNIMPGWMPGANNNDSTH